MLPRENRVHAKRHVSYALQGTCFVRSAPKHPPRSQVSLRIFCLKTIHRIVFFTAKALSGFESLLLPRENRVHAKRHAPCFGALQGTCFVRSAPKHPPRSQVSLRIFCLKTIHRIVFFTAKALSGFESLLLPRENRVHAKRHAPCFGALQGTRTPDLLVRSQSLYPAELAAHIFFAKIY